MWPAGRGRIPETRLTRWKCFISGPGSDILLDYIEADVLQDVAG